MLTTAPAKPTPTPAAAARARAAAVAPEANAEDRRLVPAGFRGRGVARRLGRRAAHPQDHGVQRVPFGGGHIIGADVYGATWRARRRTPEVRTILLGDSVARQLFPPGREPKELNGRYRFLTSNQAISMAGQYYLLQDALRSCPGATDVYLLYFPGSLANDLGPDFTHDYFCGYFHSPRQIAEVFAVKRDFTLLASQVGHGLFPNLML